MKIAKKKGRMQTPSVTPIIDLERPLEKVSKKSWYIAIQCQNTPGDNDSWSYEINFPYFEGEFPEEWLVWKDKVLKALDGQHISICPLQYTVTERHLTDDAKATFIQADLDIGICTIDNFNKVLAQITKYTFSAYSFREQKRYLRRHLVKPKSMKLRSFISRLQKLNAYLEEFPPDTEGQENTPLPADEIMDADSTIKEMTDFFETGVELGAQGR